MKKLLVFALLFVPVTSFAASSVRVLGSGSSALPGSGSATKTTNPGRVVSNAKVATPKAATTASVKAGDGSTSRIGTISAKVKKPVATISTTGTTTGSGSRVPVITPAQSYNTVAKPQSNTSGGGGTGECCDVDTQHIIDVVTERVTEQVSDKDPRVDMIYGGTPGNREAYWRGKVGNETVQRYIDDGYYFMWIEE